jgi:calcineurin-like phosphoesterase family protein
MMWTDLLQIGAAPDRKAYFQHYRRKNKKHIRGVRRRYYLMNRSRILKKHAEWQRADPARHAARMRRWRAKRKAA